jgi:hypothetical protein
MGSPGHALIRSNMEIQAHNGREIGSKNVKKKQIQTYSSKALSSLNVFIALLANPNNSLRSGLAFFACPMTLRSPLALGDAVSMSSTSEITTAVEGDGCLWTVRTVGSRTGSESLALPYTLGPLALELAITGGPVSCSYYHVKHDVRSQHNNNLPCYIS